MTAGRLALTLLLASSGALLVACGGSGSKRLQGTWKGKSTEGVAAAAVASANAFATHVSLEDKGDAITVTTPKDTQAGHYKVVSDEGPKLVITTDKDGPGEPQTFTFVDEKTVKWAVVDGQSIVFTRL